jgi:adenylate cyclase
MPPLEALRLAIGFFIPLLLAVHFTGTRVAYQLYGVEDAYGRIVPAIWHGGGTLRQLALLTIAWLHGCLGIHFVLRHRARYREHFHLLYALMVVLPVLAALGFVGMAHEIPLRVAAGELAASPPSAAASGARLQSFSDTLVLLFAAALAIVLLLRVARAQRERRLGRTVSLAYPSRTVEVPRGWTVLEASRVHGIPHLSLCGGRARCSTCRVRVEGDIASLPPPAEAERRTLQRIRAAADIRLACQLRPAGDLRVAPLLRAASAMQPTAGAEREVVVLFVDLRRWTSLAEQHLPHDLAYVLDQFFEAVGEAVRSCGGVPNQFIGDSVMALFGLEHDLPTACAQALAAARAIEAGMEGHRQRMQQEFGAALEFGIGLHAGSAAVGEVGWRETRTFSAVGDTVNTAARLQELCKEFGVRLVVSEQVLRGARVDPGALPRHEVDVRGRTDALVVYAVRTPSALPLTNATPTAPPRDTGRMLSASQAYHQAAPGDAVIGWKVDRGDRAQLLARFPPRYSRTDADHVTRVAADAALPAETVGVIVGRSDDGQGVEALVVQVDGTTDRPDGSTYHITWSLQPGRNAVESNDVIRRHGWEAVEPPAPVRLQPAPWPRSG